jgi:hypothetical protein
MHIIMDHMHAARRHEVTESIGLASDFAATFDEYTERAQQSLSMLRHAAVYSSLKLRADI